MRRGLARGRSLLLLTVLTVIVGLALTHASVGQTPAGPAAPAPTVASGSEAGGSAIETDVYGENVGWQMWLYWGLTGPVGAVVGLLFAAVFYKEMKRREVGNETMETIAGYVREGAHAYLKRQYWAVAVVFVILAVLFALMAFVLKVQSKLLPFAFLTGGIFSALSGYIGMTTATYASSRTAQAARKSLNSALQVAFRSGAVMGLVVVGFALLNSCIWFFAMMVLSPLLGLGRFTLHEISVTMLSFGIGASTQALFARVGGGIFTKAADVGADLVGKIEAGIPEDDPRNPATIADNVGDNVGDVAGMGADLFESYAASILAASALGVAAGLGFAGLTVPMMVAGIGIILSVIGAYLVRTKEDATQRNLLAALTRGVWSAAFLILVASAGIMLLVFDAGLALRLWGAIAAGLVAGVIIGRSTEYYTSDTYKPTRRVADQAKTGPATVIIEGLACGMGSTAIPVIAVCAAIIVAYGLPGGFGNQANSMNLGLFGIGLSAVGMLSTLGITLATDAYGPIADNAGGNAEMSGLEPQVRERTDALDSLGNTTAATGKGFAIGSAALTALALLAAYVDEVRVGLNREATAYVAAHQEQFPAAAANTVIYMGHHKFAQLIQESGQKRIYCLLGLQGEIGSVPTGAQLEEVKPLPEANTVFGVGTEPDGTRRELEMVTARSAGLNQITQYYSVNLLNPQVIVGLMIGAMLVFVFTSMTMRAVGRNAGRMVEEVRRQFREIPGIMEGKGKPDYAACVNIATAGAQREMVVPSLLSIVVPVAVGLILGVGGVLGLLAGGLVCGFTVAVFMANSGGSWDNAKKHIERGAMGGKGSPAHKAAVVGDTVGDPFKDTSGPSLNILIKLMSMVSVVAAGLVVKYSDFVLDFIKRLSR